MEYCVCGHEKDAHASLEGKCEAEVIWKDRNGYLSCGIFCECFKLDNLKLVEDLAKERNLI